jgi:hypothetical protein
MKTLCAIALIYVAAPTFGQVSTSCSILNMTLTGGTTSCNLGTLPFPVLCRNL